MQKKNEKKISNRGGVNPSLIINKGIYIQHVDGGLYTKENWSNKGYSNDLCNGIALVDKVCFVIATEYIGTFRWGKDGEIDNIFAQDSSNMGTIKKDYWGRENQNAYLEYDTSNTDYAFNKANSYLFKNGQNGYVGGAGEFFLISLYANEINECLLMVGGTIMSNRMWTSTRNTKFTYSWYYDINIQGDHLDTGSRGSSRYVRPFTELIL